MQANLQAPPLTPQPSSASIIRRQCHLIANQMRHGSRPQQTSQGGGRIESREVYQPGNRRPSHADNKNSFHDNSNYRDKEAAGHRHFKREKGSTSTVLPHASSSEKISLLSKIYSCPCTVIFLDLFSFLIIGLVFGLQICSRNHSSLNTNLHFVAFTLCNLIL
jgi:hypothetical protein